MKSLIESLVQQRWGHWKRHKYKLIENNSEWLAQGEEEGLKNTSLATVKMKRIDAHLEAWSYEKHKYPIGYWL